MCQISGPDLRACGVGGGVIAEEVSTEREEIDAQVVSRRKHPHAVRRAEIMAAHPEIASLVGNKPVSAIYTVILVALQYALAVLCTKTLSLTLSRSAFASSLLTAPQTTAVTVLVGIVTAYSVGAVIDHSLYVLIHDATHNLVFRSVPLNRLVLCVANIAHVLPSAILFRYYHIQHHIELNKIDKDPDVPASWEARFVGHSTFRKAMWLALFFLFQSVRMLFYAYKVPSGKELLWVAFNWVICILPACGLWWIYGLAPVAWLLFASVSSIGLHPLGARWIQEHYPTQPFQATYSYYGVANRVAFNIGFHNEHHDFPSVPWQNLPAVKKAAPEYYDTLFAYTSYSKLLADFVMERKWSLQSRWDAELAHSKHHPE